jgi:hypothetical protein
MPLLLAVFDQGGRLIPAAGAARHKPAKQKKVAAAKHTAERRQQPRDGSLKLVAKADTVKLNGPAMGTAGLVHGSLSGNGKIESAGQHKQANHNAHRPFDFACDGLAVLSAL